VARPLLWYAAAEAILAVFGILFHTLFTTVTDLSYERIFPTVGSAELVGSVRWGLAGLSILPQAIVLGATFPLMAASLVRADATRPGRGVARVYLLNTLGGAAGVLLAGFWMIGAFGLPGTSVAAAVLNLAAAAVAARSAFGARARKPLAEEPATTASADTATSATREPWAEKPRRLLALLLAVSFGTALSSFAYEVGWIRMLSLVIGSATHSFELMLSAFILGLAGGAWWIGERSDQGGDPLGQLGLIQVAMGLGAAASVPVFYWISFDAVAWLVARLQGEPGGYALFNIARYALSLLVMLPVTLLAGMTLPLITGTLLRAGAGEQAIGRVYGVNTVGSVAGATLAGLIALPWLGLKSLILAAGAVDVAIGLVLLQRSARHGGARPRTLVAASLVSAAAFAAVGLGLRLDDMVMASGVYRHGQVPREGDRLGLYHADGRTATVSAYIGTSDGVIVLATNGKPDASLDPRWLAEGRDTMPERPIAVGRDLTTQLLSPIVALAHRPEARNVANIGHGSGMSATAFLTSERLQRLVTIEIEPLMVQGSLVFLPANGPAIADPRSSYVFDDAKSFFSYQQERFDIVFAEPSNPWVSGTAGLFTVEFYERVREFLSPGGVLAQWVQIYELNDNLFLSVVAALDAVFPAYRAYLVGDTDVAIVATADGALAEPDWSVLASDGFRALMEGSPPVRAEHLEAQFLFDETTFRPVLNRGVQPNSDYRPVLDLGAERARFDQTRALGLYSFGVSRVDLTRVLREERVGPGAYHPAPSYGLEPSLLWARAAWLRGVRDGGVGTVPPEFPEFENALVDLETFLALTRAESALAGWDRWAAGFDRVEASIHWGTTGWVDTTFYREVYDFIDRVQAPVAARAAVDLKYGLSLFDWERVASAADVLVGRVAFGEQWVDPAPLLDASVVAYLRTERPDAARAALARLGPLTGRALGNLRDRLLVSLLLDAEEAAARSPSA
jgi:predicted membrane-bound spermidine synthase